jgi:hypothetical protein
MVGSSHRSALGMKIKATPLSLDLIDHDNLLSQGHANLPVKCVSAGELDF